LLLAIALAKRGAEPVNVNDEDGSEFHVLSSRDWLGILERADLIETRLVRAPGENPTRYVVDED
jgi:hypothetical protein